MIRDNLCRYARLRFYLSCFVCWLCVSLQAQQVEDSITGKVHAIPEVGIKGRRVPPALSATAPFQQMKKTDMERLGVSDVADAVRHFSGVSVKDYGGIGGLKTVSVRSLGAQHTLSLIHI